MGLTTHQAVAEACQAIVDDKARSLAEAWGLLLPLDSNNHASGYSGANGNEAIAVGTRLSAAATGGNTPPPSLSPSAAVSEMDPARGARPAGKHGSGTGSGSGRAESRVQARRTDWAPLWEAMAMLSAPSVSVGAVGAGE